MKAFNISIIEALSTEYCQALLETSFYSSVLREILLHDKSLVQGLSVIVDVRVLLVVGHAVGEHEPKVGQTVSRSLVDVAFDLVVDGPHVDRVVDDLVVVRVVLLARLLHEDANELNTFRASIPKI